MYVYKHDAYVYIICCIILYVVYVKKIAMYNFAYMPTMIIERKNIFADETCSEVPILYGCWPVTRIPKKKTTYILVYCCMYRQ